jgi:ethanolamine ammonia-lyase small subunit
MPPGRGSSLTVDEFSELVRKIRERTPARIFSGRSGAAYRTATQLELREAHAAARDAVRAELDLRSAFGVEFLERWKLFEVATEARSKEEYLLQPELGRGLSESAWQQLGKRCTDSNDVQIAIGDGLSVTAVAAQVQPLLPLLMEGARARGWTVGQAFVIRHCRVGVLNEIGQRLAPKVAVLLIGERPGLATAQSLSAYMAFRPNRTHTDANRNLISNIHARGLTPHAAAERILNLAAQMMQQQNSGLSLRKQLQATIDNPKFQI